MSRTFTFWITSMFAAVATLAQADAAGERPLIVERGRPNAEIVIAHAPTRTQKLAAEELQTYIEKISGARLTITNTLSEAVPLKIYVGRSAMTDKLGVDNAGLHDGAFRMVSGENWLVLLGRDSDFTPREPWARNHSDKARKLAEWDALTGAKWGNPVGVGMYRSHSGSLGVWEDDERGSLNAVHEFLRGLGVRWYMPGELGEIVPEKATIALPREDRVVRPDFAIRDILYFGRYGRAPEESIRWHMRLGLNHGLPKAGPHWTHGIRHVLRRDEMRAARPEYYAMLNGRRETTREHGCLSSEGLLRENVGFVRALFDTYDIAMASVMPADGFNFCQCELCAGKETLDRGRLGAHSDYVWDYVNRVAQEVHKTHPDKLIRCGAYSSYTLPPEKLAQLSPNIVVGIVHGRGKDFADPDTRRQLLELREGWLAKSPHALAISEHYVFTHRGTYTPVYFLQSIAAGLRSLKGVALGEVVETAPASSGLHVPGFNHLNVYVTARFYWDAEQNLDTLLEEYYALFYGPARDEMRAFVEYSEAHYKAMTTEFEKTARALELLDAAVAKAPTDSVYGRRIALLAEYLEALRSRRDQLAKGREGVPEVRLRVVEGANIALDGKLDEEAWQTRGGGSLKDLQTGTAPAAKTTFRTFWEGDRIKGALYVGIRCEEPDIASLKVATMKDPAAEIWHGDLVEVLLETQTHSYYQLAISPSGELVDLDRKGGRLGYDWVSRAEAAAHVGEDYWSVEIRIPVPGADTVDDPLHDVVGRYPRGDYPWYFNIARQRLRGEVREGSTFSVGTSERGRPTWHDVMRFGRLAGR